MKDVRMPEEKTYVPKSGAKEIAKNGWTMLKLSFKSADFVKFIHENTNEKGYINLCVTKRRDIGQYGDTHCVWLDTWKPSENRSPQARTPEPAQPSTTTETPENDDVPF